MIRGGTALRPLALLLFAVVLVPVSWFRRLTGVSRFGRRFHRSASSWDLGAVPGPDDGHPPA